VLAIWYARGGAPTQLADIVAPSVEVASKQQNKYSSTSVDPFLVKQMSRLPTDNYLNPAFCSCKLFQPRNVAAVLLRLDVC
jgi:hypothetical protein